MIAILVAAIALFTAPLMTSGQVDDAYTTYKNRAVMEKANGDLKGAMADFTRAIKLKPNVPDGYNDRGLVEYAKRDWKSAIADFSKAIELKPDFAEAYKNRASAEYAKGDAYGSRLDEAKAIELRKDLVGRLPTSRPSSLESTDVLLATCPTDRQLVFARGQAYRAYPGCALPRDQVAMVNLIGSLNILPAPRFGSPLSVAPHVKYVDGVAAYNVPAQGKEKREYYLDNAESIELLPGRHRLTFVLFEVSQTRQNGSTPGSHDLPGVYVETDIKVEQNIDVEAGKTYTAIARKQDTGQATARNAESTSPTVSSSMAVYTLAESQFWVEIAEFQNDPAVYLQLYNAHLKNGDSAAALSELEAYLALFPRDPNHKTAEEMAGKLRESLNRAQMEAYRTANSGPNGLAPNQTPAPAVKVRGCVPVQSAQTQPKENAATPLTLKGASSGAVQTDMNLVLSRATRYVEDYELKLGSVIGEEVYVQTPTFRESRLGTMFPAGGRVPQRTEADFAILQVGQEWVGVRDVNCVDGKVVQHEGDDLRKMLDHSPTEVRTTIDNILRENAHYNIGFIQRNTNLPTFALRILRTENIGRFEFKKIGETSFGGIRTWAVGFQETYGPTMIHDGDNNEEFANGTLWIEPETGQILKTEVNDAGRQGSVPFRAQTVVSYKNNPKLAMLVPVSMAEHYETNDSRKLDCRADYFNFRRFQVETHLDFGSPIRPVNPPGIP